MNKQQILISSAIASIVALGLSTGVHAEDKADKEKCYGVAKAGKNDCAAPNGSHSCAGQSKADNDGSEWKYVAKGTCGKLGGATAPKK